MDWNGILSFAGSLVVAFAVAASARWLHERSKYKWEQYKKKEKRYVALINRLNGFYASADADDAKAKKGEFLDQLTLAWLYCPDEVIRKCYRFLETVSASDTSEEAKKQALGEVVLEARKDLMGKGWLWRKKTKLAPDDFQILRST